MDKSAKRVDFDKFVRRRMADFDTFAGDISDALFMVDEFYQQPDDKIKKTILAKMEKGGAEHGDKSFDLTPAQVRKEIYAEAADALGWYYFILYHEDNKKNEKATQP